MMKVQLVCSGPSQAAVNANRRVLSPELLSAVAARYSRNDNGLDEILELISKKDPETSIDSIFKMVDYGHASIADIAQISIFMDGISIWLAYYVFSICPRANGQETSTRYVKFDTKGMLSATMAGIPKELQSQWNVFLKMSIEHYQSATKFWEKISMEHPELIKIPTELLAASKADDATGHKDRLVMERLRRNFVFDRARYFIPVAAFTNFTMTMPARDWVELVKILSSHYIPEAVALADRLVDELSLIVPRLMKHCEATEDRRYQHISQLQKAIGLTVRPYTTSKVGVSIDAPSITTNEFEEYSDLDLAFEAHINRYAYIGPEAQRINVRFAIPDIAMAELRDLNRHRTGYKYCPASPVGFYTGYDQVPTDVYAEEVNTTQAYGEFAYQLHKNMLLDNHKSHPYWSLLGTQYYYEHSTTLDKLVYEIELRTGLGAHFKYREHMLAVHKALLEKLPQLEGMILIGQGEPE